MRIVHSFWSKPMLDSTGNTISNLSFSSWVNKHMFYYTYVLSTLLVEKHYKGQTTLVTDEFGKKLLIDTLRLPYDDVIVELDALNHYPKEFWALGKIYTYSLFDTPFIHLDYDFLLAKPFEKSFINADLVAYADENDDSRQKPYKRCIDEYFSKYIIPSYLKQYFDDYRYIAYNAGVFGGNEVSIFKDLWLIAQEIINLNFQKILQDVALKNASFSMTNVILEQYLFACMAHEKKLNVACLHENENLQPDETNFWLNSLNLPKYKASYFPEQHVHMVGHFKSSIDNAISIEQNLKNLSPDYIFFINNLLDKRII